MNKSKKVLISLAGLITVVGLSGIAMSASAHEGQNQGQGQRQKPPRMSPEVREAWQQAIADRDYDAWVEIAGDRPITEKINSDNFDQFAEAFTLMKDGDKEGAKAIFDELGLKRKPGHKNRPKIDKEKMAAIKQALDNADYNAWLAAVGDGPITEKINEENFDRLVEAHNLMKAGDKEGAREIFKELDLKRPHRKGHRPGPKPSQDQQPQ